MNNPKEKKIITDISKLPLSKWCYVNNGHFFLIHKSVLVSIRSNGVGTTWLTIDGFMFRNSAVSLLWGNLFEYHESKQRDHKESTIDSIYESFFKK